MLENAHSRKRSKKNVHREGVTKFRERVGDASYAEIQGWIMSHFDEGKWVNTSFVSPKTWEGTPLQAIWEYFSDIPDHGIRHEQSAMLYGCVFYTELFDRPEVYIFHRHEGNHSDETRPYGLSYLQQT